ncbi:hypothetical protein Scep_001675 [Stephania cephalantha]|uniref:Uncharacterized protein n=1 Tax=Stephania cephalantha TaxID=152367 RepID=A0AAP0P9X9_9MAGN
MISFEFPPLLPLRNFFLYLSRLYMALLSFLESIATSSSRSLSSHDFSFSMISTDALGELFAFKAISFLELLVPPLNASNLARSLSSNSWTVSSPHNASNV